MLIISTLGETQNFQLPSIICARLPLVLLLLLLLVVVVVLVVVVAVVVVVVVVVAEVVLVGMQTLCLAQTVALLADAC